LDLRGLHNPAFVISDGIQTPPAFMANFTIQQSQLLQSHKQGEPSFQQLLGREKTKMPLHFLDITLLAITHHRGATLSCLSPSCTPDGRSDVELSTIQLLQSEFYNVPGSKHGHLDVLPLSKKKVILVF
jgi:hypothetical protein